MKKRTQRIIATVVIAILVLSMLASLIVPALSLLLR